MKHLIAYLTLFSCCLSNPIHAETNQPNILLLLGDDIDRDSLGPWGGPALTPNLDKLAAKGIRLNKVYANVAMCAPFRQEMYSGRCAWRTRTLPNHSKSIEGTKSLPHYLRPLGYNVGLLGKSHVGPREAYPFDKVGDLPMKEDANEKAVELARDYMLKAKAADKPFCLVVASHDGHGPYTHGDTSKYNAKELPLDSDTIDTTNYRHNLVNHLAEVTNLDALLGSLQKTLVEEKLSSNTLVIFCSEQGNAYPFAKWTCYEDGLASGVVASMPGKIPAGTSSDQIMWISDFVPTLIEAAGGKVEQAHFDGKSQWSNLTGSHTEIHKYAFGAFSNCNIIDNRERVFPIRSVRDSRYTLIWCPKHDQEITSNTTLTQALSYIETGAASGPNVATSWAMEADKNPTPMSKKIVKRLHHRPEWALYDRENDPEEMNNLIGETQLSEKSAELKTALADWLQKWADSDPIATEQSFVKKKKKK